MEINWQEKRRSNYALEVYNHTNLLLRYSNELTEEEVALLIVVRHFPTMLTAPLLGNNLPKEEQVGHGDIRVLGVLCRCVIYIYKQHYRCMQPQSHFNTYHIRFCMMLKMPVVPPEA